MMSCTIERPVNKQTIYRWPLNRLCFQVVVPDPTHRCCFPRAAVPCSSASCQGNLPYLLQLHLRFCKNLCAPSPRCLTPVPKVSSSPQFAVWRSRLWCLSSFVCALSLCQLASRGAAKWHPRSLSHSRHVLHSLTHGEWLTNTNMKTILTEQGLGAGRGERKKKISRKIERVQHMLFAFTSSINIYCISYNWVSPL